MVRQTDYIRFCEESVVPTRKVHYFPNSKPLIKRSLKILLNRKKKAFMAGDHELSKKKSREQKRELRRAKDSNKNRIEVKLQHGNAREVWAGGLRTLLA